MAVMNEIALVSHPLDSCLAWGCKKNLELLKKEGFTES